MVSNIKLILKDDWDVMIHPPKYDKDERGHFAGRLRESEFLTNEILRKQSGSILISGYRGVGKTSLIYKVLRDIKKKFKKKKSEYFLTILMNAAQLEIDSKEKNSQNNCINPRKIIENLIRRLYTAVKDNSRLDRELEKNIENLYRKAISSQYSHITKEATVNEVLLKKEKDIEWKFSIKDFRNLISFFGWLVSFMIISLSTAELSVWFKILAISSSFPIPLLINSIFSWKISSSKIKSKKENRSAEELYEIDNSVANLEFDLEAIHHKLREKGFKIVYVIDELDKLNQDQVKEVIKFFKNLFTLSDAIFIFLADEDFYSLGIELSTPNPTYREKEYTYFTSRYFIQRPNFDDIDTFLNDIFLDREDLCEDEDFIIFKELIALNAQNDYFDIITALKDKITQFDELNHGIIEIESFSHIHYLKSHLYHISRLLYEEIFQSSDPSKWQENEAILRLLFKNIKEIVKLVPNQTIDDPEINNIENEMVRNYFDILRNIGILEFVQTTKNVQMNLTSVKINRYKFTKELPKRRLDSIHTLFEHERNYIHAFNQLLEFQLIIMNSLKKAWLTEEITSQGYLEVLNEKSNSYPYLKSRNDILKTHLVYVKKIKELKRKHNYQRESIINFTKEITNQYNNRRQYIFANLRGILKDMFPSFEFTFTNLKNIHKDFLEESIKIYNVLTQVNPPIMKPNTMPRSLIFLNNRHEILNPFASSIEKYSNIFRLVYISDTTKESDEIKKIPSILLIDLTDNESFKLSFREVINQITEFWEYTVEKSKKKNSNLT